MELLKQYPAGILADLSPEDGMYIHDSSPDPEVAYFEHGRAGLDAVRLALILAQKETVTSILDLPSGYGRVMRFLRAEFPDASITACDVIREGVDFCAEHFGAKAAYGREHPAEVETEDKFDLIWCGSLLSHLDVPGWREFLDFFQSVLVPQGVLVFTTLGRSIAAQLRDPERGHLIFPNAPADEILRGFDEADFGYGEYVLPDDFRRSLSMPDRYGIAVAHPAWTCAEVAKRPNLQLIAYMENRWSGQDVVACMAVDGVTMEANPLRIPWARGGL
jgi:SAM-dependent methyltransferase